VYYLIAKNSDLLTQLFGCVCNNLNTEYKIPSLKIFIKFLEQLIKDFAPSSCKSVESPEKKDTDEPETEFEEMDPNLFRINSDSKFSVDLDIKNYLDIFNVIYSYLEIVCLDFMKNPDSNFTLFTCFEQEIPKLGYYKTVEFEYIVLIFDLVAAVFKNNNINIIEIANKSLDLLIDKFIDLKLFDIIVKYFFLYEWNSFYQNMFERLVSCLVQKNIPEKLIVSFFSSSGLINKIVENCFNTGLSFKSGCSIFPGYFANLCHIMSIIKKSENIHLLKILSISKKINDFYSYQTMNGILYGKYLFIRFIINLQKAYSTPKKVRLNKN
jgi:hypothetical protein